MKKEKQMNQNTLPGNLSDEKLRKKLQSLLNPYNGKLYQRLQNGYLRVQVEPNRIAFYAQEGLKFKLASFISVTSLVDMFAKNNAETLFALSIPVHKETVLQFIYNYVNSDACQGVYMQGNDIMLGAAAGSAPGAASGGYKTCAMDVAYMATSAYMMGYINFHIHPDKGSHLLYHLLQSGQAEYLRVEVTETAVHFWMHKTGKNDNNVVTLTFEFVNKVNPEAEELYQALCTQDERSQLLHAIEDYINSVECPGVYMKSGRIYLEKGAAVKPVEPVTSLNSVKPAEPPKPAESDISAEPVKPLEKPEHPDMYESMTSHGIWLALHESFGEGSSFETMVKTVPATCLVTAEREALIVTVMLENEEHVNMVGNGGTTVFEYNYSKCTNKGFQQALESGKTVTHEDMLHNFDVLEHEEDRAELVDYLLYFIDTIPHIIVEGNSFRSRRPGEEIIDIDHSLTAKVMSHKVLQLFGLDGEAMDILRRSNIAYCLICSYADYIKLIYVDTDDETIHAARYDFADLVSEDFLAGEGCFSRLTCNYEKDSLDEYLGRAVCSLPYFTPCMTSEGEMYCQVYLNKTIVPGLDEPFIPASNPEPDPAKSDEPDEPVIPDTPESPAEEPKHPDMYESLTARGITREIEENFGENTPFAYMAQQIPVTCYVTVQDTSVGITVMVEDEEKAQAMGGYTKSYALMYSQAAMKGMQAKMEAGAVLTPESFLNDFDCLDCEEDRDALLNYLMQTIAAFPHVVTEGNSFRSRKDDEVLVDVEHSLTAKVMSNKIAKLFSMDSRAVDILRRKNVMFCQIAAYRDFVKLIYADADFEVLDSDCYEFSELVDADFLEGEGCFDHLESENEQIRLSKYLGEKVCQLPHIMAMADESQVYHDMVLLNEELVPVEPDEPRDMDGPVGGPDFYDPLPEDPIVVGGMPVAPDEPESPVYTMQSSPTTWAMVAYLNMQFAQGGGLARFMKDSEFKGAEVKAGQSELMIRFWKYHNNTPERIILTAMMMQYSQFNKGAEGEFEGFLEDWEMDELEKIIKMAVPVFNK